MRRPVGLRRTRHPVEDGAGASVKVPSTEVLPVSLKVIAIFVELCGFVDGWLIVFIDKDVKHCEYLDQLNRMVNSKAY